MDLNPGDPEGMDEGMVDSSFSGPSEDKVLTYRWYDWRDWCKPVDGIRPTVEIRVRARPDDDATDQFRLHHELRRALKEVEKSLNAFYLHHAPPQQTGWPHPDTEARAREQRARHSKD